MAFSAADVGKSIDVLIDGQGYIFDDTIDPTSLYSSRQRAQFGLSPVFVERQNIQGDYGDNQQDFFLTFTQRDWSLGEQQRYARPNDDDSARRYWIGAGIDISVPGQVKLAQDITSGTFAAAVSSPAQDETGGGTKIAVGGATNLYEYGGDTSTAIATAHGAGGVLTAIITDGRDLYVTDSNETTPLRKLDGSLGTFSDFGTASANRLAFLNNTLYGLQTAGPSLVRWDTAGTLTTLYSWKSVSGSTLFADARLVAFGGKLAILLKTKLRTELWIYDGTAPVIAAIFPADFTLWDLEEIYGMLLVSGVLTRYVAAATVYRPIVFYYANGTIGELWRGNSDLASLQYPAMARWRDGMVINDAENGALVFYNPATGGVSTIASLTSLGSNPVEMASNAHILHIGFQGSASAFVVGMTGTVASGSISTSLIDFDSSLTKNFHGVRVEFDSASDGNGGTVDIAYRVGDVSGTYTSLATGVASGTEIALSGVSGKSISIKVTLNKGTSTNGPALKRISVRASPVQPQYTRCLYTLALYGTDLPPEPAHMIMRDDSPHPKSGAQMAADLKTAAARTTPISITDELNGTYTGVVEADSVNIDRIRRGEYRAQLIVRSV